MHIHIKVNKLQLSWWCWIIILMKVAQHPPEPITYGGNGSVFQNWAQYRLIMKYLSEMNDMQTLVIYSKYPMGLFPSQKISRVVVTNGMMIPNYSKQDDRKSLMLLVLLNLDKWHRFIYVYWTSRYSSWYYYNNSKCFEKD